MPRAAASTSGERISASPTSTASTPAAASSSSCSGRLNPDSATTSAWPSMRTSNSNVRRVSTSSVRRSRLLIPMIAGRTGSIASAASSSRSSWTSTSALSPSPLASAMQRGQLAGRQRGDDQEDRVGPGRRRLVHLVGVDDEVLAQQRQGAGAARGARDRRASRRSSAFGEDRERRGAAPLVGPRRRPRGRDRPGSARPRGSGACARRSATARGARGRPGTSGHRPRRRVPPRRARARRSGVARRRSATCSRVAAMMGSSRFTAPRELVRALSRTARARRPPRRRRSPARPRARPARASPAPPPA